MRNLNVSNICNVLKIYIIHRSEMFYWIDIMQPLCSNMDNPTQFCYQGNQNIGGELVNGKKVTSSFALLKKNNDNSFIYQ